MPHQRSHTGERPYHRDHMYAKCVGETFRGHPVSRSTDKVGPTEVDRATTNA